MKLVAAVEDGFPTGLSGDGWVRGVLPRLARVPNLVSLGDRI